MNFAPSGDTLITGLTLANWRLRSTTPLATSYTKAMRLVVLGKLLPMMYRPSRLAERKLRGISAGRPRFCGGSSGLAGAGGVTGTAVIAWFVPLAAGS
jgi:hypothetical protein